MPRHSVYAAIQRLAMRSRRSAALALLDVPRYEGVRVTAKRLANLYLSRYETLRLKTTLRSYPIKLTVEPSNLCNLRCPACFTGDGQVGRKTGAMPLPLYRRLLAEIGDYLFQIEFTNWGEPLLSKDFYTMVAEASARGISTITSTNFSLPFDAARAEQLIASGLDVFGVSIDGARQETYVQYRVRGSLERVLDNCRLVADAKRRLGAAKPKLVWEFHAFPHNLDDIDRARTMAAELGMEFALSKGWQVGADWDPGGAWQFSGGEPEPFPCLFLWHFAVVNNDGGVAPCCGAFYAEDDMGRLALSDDDAGGAPSFRAVWNGERFRAARQLYRGGAAADGGDAICDECPTTLNWQRWRGHLAEGGALETFASGFSSNDGFNYFWQRRPPAARQRRPG